MLLTYVHIEFVSYWNYCEYNACERYVAIAIGHIYILYIIYIYIYVSLSLSLSSLPLLLSLLSSLLALT